MALETTSVLEDFFGHDALHTRPVRMKTASRDSLNGFSQLLKALADPVRLRILHLLLAEEGVCVGHLGQALMLPQPTVSRHLAYLRKHGLVTANKSGFWVQYALASPRSDFHRCIVACLDECLAELDELLVDRDRLRHIMAHGDTC